MNLRRTIADTVSLTFAAWWLASTGVAVSVMMIANRIDTPAGQAKQAFGCFACRGDRYVCNLCFRDGARCKCSDAALPTSIPCSRCAR